MAVVSIKNKLRRGNLLVGNDPFIPSDYESIATVTVGSGGSSSITFSNIPTTYAHLQLRAAYTFNGNGGTARARVGNGSADTGSNYASHYLEGDGSAASASAYAPNYDLFYLGLGWERSDRQVFVMDFLDYSNTNKFKTIRTLMGYDANGSGKIALQSSLWRSTSALDYITFSTQLNNFSEYSHFALYGIKG
jgi:hypothetical protein